MDNTSISLLTVGYQAPGSDSLVLTGFLLVCGDQFSFEAVDCGTLVDPDERDIVLGLGETVAHILKDHGVKAGLRLLLEASNAYRLSEPLVLPHCGVETMRRIGAGLVRAFEQAATSKT